MSHRIDLTRTTMCDTLTSEGYEKGRGGEEMGNTNIYWGCPRCRVEFAGDTTPHHELEMGDVFSSATWIQKCSGTGKPLVKWKRENGGANRVY